MGLLPEQSENSKWGVVLKQVELTEEQETENTEVVKKGTRKD